MLSLLTFLEVAVMPLHTSIQILSYRDVLPVLPHSRPVLPHSRPALPHSRPGLPHSRPALPHSLWAFGMRDSLILERGLTDIERGRIEPPIAVVCHDPVAEGKVRSNAISVTFD